MIRKDVLLQRIDEALRVEEDAAAICHQQLPEVLPWLAYEEDERRLIEESLLQLGTESAQHKAILENVRQLVEEDGRDVF